MTVRSIANCSPFVSFREDLQLPQTSDKQVYPAQYVPEILSVLDKTLLVMGPGGYR